MSRIAPRRLAALGTWHWGLVAVAGLAVAYAGWHQLASAETAVRVPAPAEVPVHVGAVEKMPFPLVLNGLGTVQATNTVTVRSRVDGQIEKVGFEEGQIVKEGDLLVQIDPAPFKASPRSGHGQAGAGPGQPHQCQAGPGAHDPAVQAGRRHPAAARPAHRQRRQSHRPGAGRPGGDRERQGAARLHHDPLAADRPRRLSPGRSRQHRARRRPDRHADHHAAAADLGGLHRTRAAAARHQRGTESRDR